MAETNKDRRKAKREREQIERRKADMYETRRREKRAPLIQMVANGKDEGEAAIFFMMSRTLDEINYDCDDPFFSKDFSDRQKAQHRSLRWNAEEVLRDLIRSEDERTFGKQRPTAFKFDPMFAQYWERIRHTALDLQITLANIREGVRRVLAKKHTTRAAFALRKRDLKKDVETIENLVEAVVEDKAELFLVIGFCLGLRAYRQKLQTELDTMKFGTIERFTIKKPEHGKSEGIGLASFRTAPTLFEEQ